MWRGILILLAFIVMGVTVPALAQDVVTASVEGKGTELILALDAAPGWQVKDPKVLIDLPDGVEMGSWSWDGGIGRAQVQSVDGEPVQLGGKVSWTACSDTECRLGSHPIMAQVTPMIAASMKSTLAWTLLLALLGGALLNLAPCVLPVIGLKVLHWVGSGQHRVRLGLSYSAGLVISFLIMGVALVLLRQGGEALGWGFHLQNPIFVALLVGLFFLMGLSLLGLFEMGLGAVGGGRKGAFLSGMVTTLAAAVCIGPLLGPVFGAAALLPATQAVLLYTTVGIGMAIPYLLLAAVPQWLKWLPKPGEWLHVLQQIFGFMMLAAALWLLWVFDGQTSAGQTVFLCAWLLPLAVAAWLFGRWGHAGRARRSRLIAGVIAAALAVTSVTGLISTARITTHSQELQAYQPYSKERLATLRSENKPVFIDVTARWCLICQSNRSALHDSKVLAMAKEKGITLLEADYTNSDPAIGELLREHGRDGVPLYLLYAPNKPAKILPQSLKSDLLVSEFSKL